MGRKKPTKYSQFALPRCQNMTGIHVFAPKRRKTFCPPKGQKKQTKKEFTFCPLKKKGKKLEE